MAFFCCCKDEKELDENGLGPARSFDDGEGGVDGPQSSSLTDLAGSLDTHQMPGTGAEEEVQMEPPLPQQRMVDETQLQSAAAPMIIAGAPTPPSPSSQLLAGLKPSSVHTAGCRASELTFVAEPVLAPDSASLSDWERKACVEQFALLCGGAPQGLDQAHLAAACGGTADNPALRHLFVALDTDGIAALAAALRSDFRTLCRRWMG